MTQTIRKRRWKLRKVPYIVPKFHELHPVTAKNMNVVFTHPPKSSSDWRRRSSHWPANNANISSFRQLPSELAERNPDKTGHMLGSKCDLKMHVRNLGYSLPIQIRAPEPPFSTTSQLNGKFNYYIFGVKHGIDNRESALETTRGLLHRQESSWTLVNKRLKIEPAFLPTLRKFCILLHCQASQAEVSKRNSTKLCQTVDVRLR